MLLPRGVWALTTGIAILAGTCLPSLSADTRWAGYLLDRSCADNFKAQGLTEESAKSHKKECALNETCSKDGYAIISKGKIYFLDVKGNELARQMLQKSSTTEGHFVVVLGEQGKGAIRVNSIRELAAQ
jgi:hypothetical protein